MSKTRIQNELARFIPAYCANCGRICDRKDVKELETVEHDEQVAWSTFCGYCGAIYRVEIAP